MKLAKPQLPLRELLTPFPTSRLAAELTIERAILGQSDCSGKRAANVSFEESLFDKVQLGESYLEKLGLTDCVVRGCDFSAARCSESSYLRVQFSNGRMLATDLSRSTIRDVVFRDCKLSLANLRFSKLVRVQFIGCLLDEVDFQGSELHDVSFQDCHMEKTEFAHCSLKNVDARTSQLIDIRGWRSLQGLQIDSMQLVYVASQLALELGLRVED